MVLVLSTRANAELICSMDDVFRKEIVRADHGAHLVVMNLRLVVENYMKVCY